MADSQEMSFIANEVGVVKFKGIFDLSGMLRMMHSYIRHKGYDFYETTHKAKVPELELTWECEKKVTGYEQYKIKIDFHFFDLKQVEIEDNGEKRKMTEGRFTITFDGGVERGFATDWGSKKDPFKAKLRDFFNKMTEKEWMVKHASALVDEVVELRDKTNSFLGMVASY